MNISKASEFILDQNQHIANKMRALFYLRNNISEESVAILCNAFVSKSVLFKHEVAYVLGQMRLNSSINTLIKVLDNDKEDEIVRHEAAEALGNFPHQKNIIDVLERNLVCGSIPVQETCYLALKKIKENKDVFSKFHSRDPAIHDASLNFSEARKIFLDREECLYRRYQAMFYLRDNGSAEAIEILGEGMSDKSFLFKHEIAFVFGQMANPLAIDYLIRGMKNEEEHGMVRHECAEALGIIGNDACLKELVKYQHSDCDILRESVEVAIDLHGYMNSNEEDYCVIKE